MAYTLGRVGTIAPGQSELGWLQAKDLRPAPPMQNPFGGQSTSPQLGFDDVGVVTVHATIEIEPGQTTDATTLFAPFLILTFVTDNNDSVVEVDLRRGTVYAAPGRLVTVGFNYPKIVGSLQPVLRLSVGVGRGASWQRFAATRSVLASDPQGNPFTRLPIPSMAKSAVLVAPAAGNGMLNQYGGSGASPLISAAAIGQTEAVAVPIANGAEFFDIAAGIANAVVQFQLS